MNDQTADDGIARLHRCAISTRDAAIDITTFARTGADRHERQHAEEFIAAATRHADTVEACTYYAKAWLTAARLTAVDEHAARLRQRIDACVTIAEALDEASAALRHWSVKRWAPNVNDTGD